MNDMTYNVHSVAENVWGIQEGRMVTAYLVVGSKCALLIDAGGALPAMREQAESITDLPIILTLTHGHDDHILCISQFEKAHIDPADMYLVESSSVNKGNCQLVPVEEGHIFDLGDRQIETIALRGHTRGGLAYLDRKNRLLFSGDTINLGPIFMFMEESSLDTLISELEKFDAMDSFDQVFPAHNVHPIGRERIKDIISCAKAVKDGSLEGIKPPAGMPPMPEQVKLYMKDGCGLLY